MHPHNRVSEVQRRQMTTILGDNIHNIAIEGNFDDCQEMVKASFADQGFLKGTRLVAVNSINWARIMAQIVYYFHAALQLGAPHRSVAFSVPTGNFGDIFAGYLARNMGLPVSQLIVATNRNDILHRFMSGNRYDKDTLHPSLSPSMDIMVSSNFERLLFDLHGRNGKAVAELLDAFKASGKLSVEDQRWTEARKLFDSLAVSDEQTCETIAEVYRSSGELLDPHTAIGVRAARECRRSLSVPMVTLGTAHPVKFPKRWRRPASARHRRCLRTSPTCSSARSAAPYCRTSWPRYRPSSASTAIAASRSEPVVKKKPALMAGFFMSSQRAAASLLREGRSSLSGSLNWMSLASL